VGRPKTYDRDDVLRKATRLFWERGYEGTHLADLVEATGINRFSLYKEFGGKQGLFEEALQAYIDDLGDVQQTLAREPLGLDNVRAFFRAMLEYGFHHGCFVLNTIREKHVIGDGAWRTTQQFTADSEAAIRRNLEAAQARGDLEAETDVEALARFLVALDIGMLTYGILQPDVPPRAAALAFVERVLV
jgi:TetR/AcrR family transcriptional repressor of nem operon